MPEPIPVTFVAHDVGPVGGMERQLSEVIGGLLASGRRVTVVARRCELPSHPLLRAVLVPGPRRPFVVAYPFFFVVGSWILARRRRGVVITTGSVVWNRVDAATVHFCHAARAHSVQDRSARQTPLYGLNGWLGASMARTAERFCYTRRVAMSLIAVSDGIANELSTHFPCLRQLITVIPNGVDLDRFTPDSKARAKVRRELGLGPDTFTALFVGGDWNRKGLQHVIDSLALSPLAELIVVGRGDQPRFESLARAKGVLSRVHFVGRQEEVQRYYAAADVFVLPSAYEAFPLVVLEAAASGLPLLVTQVHGASEITEDGVTGFRVDPEPSDIGLRLNDLAADPERRARMGAAARSRVSGHSWQHVVDSYSAAADRLGTRAAWEISDREERSQITPKT